MKKSNQYSVRLDPELQEEFERACEATGMEPGLLLRECLKAFVEEVKRTGEIRLPLAIVPRKEVDALKLTASSRTDSTAGAPPSGRRGVGDAIPAHTPVHGANEEPGEYRPKPKPKGKRS